MANTALRAIRESLRLSQDEFAQKIREAGAKLGEPNECTTRTVQRWETGNVSYPRRHMVRAIELVAGYPAEKLGFDHVPRGESYWDHTDGPVQVVADARMAPPSVTIVMPTLTGIWESRCTYHSSSRDETFVDLSHLMLIHSANEITAHSIRGSVTDGGSIIMRLETRGRVVTGTWEQTTGAESYYRGQLFHGAVQLQVEASGTRMKGAWTGFGSDFDVNTGPWELIRRETGTRDVESYARVPDPSA